MSLGSGIDRGRQQSLGPCFFGEARTEHIYHRIRLGFSTIVRREDLKTGLSVVRRLIDNPNSGYDSYG